MMSPLNATEARPLYMGRRRQTGTAMIEFLIVAPLLLLLVLGVAEFGRLIQHNEILNKAVRNAARYAAEQTTGSFGTITLTPAVVSRIQNLAVYGQTTAAVTPMLPGLAIDDITVSEPVTNHVQVTANYIYQPLWGGVVPTFGLGGGDITLSLPIIATSIMRALL